MAKKTRLLGKTVLILLFILLSACLVQAAPTHSIKLLKNTDLCLINCETIYEVCALTKDVSVDFKYNKITSLEVKNSDPWHLFPARNARLIQDTFLPTAKVLLGSKEESKGVMVKQGSCQKISVKAQKDPFENVDNIPVVDGTAHTEFIWWNSTWQNRVQFNVSSQPTTNNSVSRLYIDDETVLPCANTTSYSDLRAVWSNSTHNIEMPVWAYKLAANQVYVYVKLTNLTGGKYWLYCNAPGAPANDGDDVFYFFDDFNTAYNNTKWIQVLTGGSITWGTSSRVRISAGNNQLAYIYTNTITYPKLDEDLIVATAADPYSNGGDCTTSNAILIYYGLANENTKTEYENIKWGNYGVVNTNKWFRYQTSTGYDVLTPEWDLNVYETFRTDTATSQLQYYLNTTKIADRDSAKAARNYYAYVQKQGTTTSGSGMLDLYFVGYAPTEHINLTLLPSTTIEYTSPINEYTLTNHYLNLVVTGVNATPGTSWANLSYNGQDHAGTLISTTNDIYRYQVSLTTPSICDLATPCAPATTANVNFTWNYNLSGLSGSYNGTQVINSKSTYTINLLNESGGQFDPNITNSTILHFFCTGKTTNQVLTAQQTNLTVGADCNPSSARIYVTMDDVVYYRSLIPTLSSLDLDWYLINLDIDTAIQKTFYLNDPVSQYIDGQFKITKLLSNSTNTWTVTINEDLWDVERKNIAYLIPYQSYSLVLYDNDNNTRTLSPFLADLQSTHTISPSLIPFSPENTIDDFQWRYEFKKPTNTTNGWLFMQFQVTAGTPHSTIFTIVNASNTSQVFLNQTLAGNTGSVNYTSILWGTTYLSYLIYNHSSYSEHTDQRVWNDIARLIHDTLSGFKDPAGFKKWFSFIIIVIFTLIFTGLSGHVSAGAITCAGITTVFYWIDWLPIPTSVLIVIWVITVIVALTSEGVGR